VKVHTWFTPVTIERRQKMAIAVMITRQFKKGEIEIHQANDLNLKLRALATVQPGFISGQSMISLRFPFLKSIKIL
jgi:hypothetical protein